VLASDPSKDDLKILEESGRSLASPG
jgi:hypothetical protein